MSRQARIGRPSRKSNLVYKVIILPAAQKQILAFSTQERLRAVQIIDRLAGNPRPEGCKKLKGTELWRVRSGQLRTIYSIYDKELRIVILKAAKREEDTFKNLS